MSTRRDTIRAETRGASQINVRERVAHGIDCAHCTRDSMVIVNGVLTWKSPHGQETHPNAVTMSALLEIYISMANRPTLLDLRRLIDERIEEIV